MDDERPYWDVVSGGGPCGELDGEARFFCSRFRGHGGRHILHGQVLGSGQYVILSTRGMTPEAVLEDLLQMEEELLRGC